MYDPPPMKGPVLAVVRFTLLGCLAVAAGFAATEGVLRLLGFAEDSSHSIRVAYDLSGESVGAFKPNLDVSVSWPPEMAYRMRTNSLGCRGPEPRAVDAPAIVCVGDSRTFGLGLQDDETWPALLDARLAAAGTPRPVLNQGCGHLHIEDEREYLARALKRLKVGVVVFMTAADGYLDAPEPSGETPHQNAKRHEERRRKRFSRVVEDLALYRARTLTKLWRERQTLVGRGLFPPDFSNGDIFVPDDLKATLRERFRGQAKLLKEEAEKAGAKFVFMAWPEVRAARGGAPEFRAPWARTVADELGCTTVDLHGALLAARDPTSLLQLPWDLHPSRRGMDLIAAEVQKVLEREGMLR